MFKRLLAANFRKPGLLFGHLAIKTLRKNQIEYDELEPLLKLSKGDIILEIGYGLGQGIHDYSEKFDATFYGIDFSRLMYLKARSLNREKINQGKVILQCADFDDQAFDNTTFHCIYFLNVIYFWKEFQPRLKKIFSLLKHGGKVIIFMADAERFKDYKQPAGKPIFYPHRVVDVVKEMEDIGFKAIETIEHSKESKCYYLIGYKK